MRIETIKIKKERKLKNGSSLYLMTKPSDLPIECSPSIELGKEGI